MCSADSLMQMAQYPPRNKVGGRCSLGREDLRSGLSSPEGGALNVISLRELSWAEISLRVALLMKPALRIGGSSALSQCVDGVHTGDCKRHLLAEILVDFSICHSISAPSSTTALVYKHKQ